MQLPLEPVIEPTTSSLANPEYSGYQPSPLNLVESLITTAQAHRPARTFVDLGCGLGEPFKVAEQVYDRVIGIEVDREMFDKAVERWPHHELHRTSAEDYRLPDERAHVFLFNPFSAGVLEQFIDNNLENIVEHGSLILLYDPAVLGPALFELGFEPFWEDNDLAVFGR